MARITGGVGQISDGSSGWTDALPLFERKPQFWQVPAHAREAGISSPRKIGHDYGMGLFVILAAGALCASPSVHDGDTLRCGAERIRIANIDAPELPGSPKCKDYRRAYAWCDYAKGYEARNALQVFLTQGHAQVRRMGTDKYGRTLARITVNGQDAGAYLVRLGLARWWQ